MSRAETINFFDGGTTKLLIVFNTHTAMEKTNPLNTAQSSEIYEIEYIFIYQLFKCAGFSDIYIAFLQYIKA